MTSSLSPPVPSRGSPVAPVPAHWDEANFTTATDVLPVRVPLERVEIGRWKYVATDLGDLELLYELESSSLRVNCGVRGVSRDTPPAIFRVCDISAADLSLSTVIPGSLESMVARLVLETEEPLECSVSKRDRGDDGKRLNSDHGVDTSCDSSPNNKERESGSHEGSKTEEEERAHVKMVHSRIVVMTASVHEAGHLRDILLFLKGGYSGKVSPDSLFLSPQSAHRGKDETDASLLDQSGIGTSQNHGMTFLEALPVWARYVPWWVYSRNVRISIQNVLFLYSLFSVIWAFWQLYRNVDVIQNVLEPIIAALKDVYLASIIEVFDMCLAVFTEFWMRFLSPLNIIQALLLAPVLQALVQLKVVFLPLAQLMYSILYTVWQCLPNTQLLSSLRSLFVSLYGIAFSFGQALWMVGVHLTRPVQYIWQGVLNSRIAVGSLDLKRLKISWVLNLMMGSLRSIGNGVAKLCGYTSRKRKLMRAKRHPTQFISPTHRQPSVHPRTPVYYSSPLTKSE